MNTPCETPSPILALGPLTSEVLHPLISWSSPMAALAEKANPPRRPDPVRWITCLFLLVLISPALLVAILLSVVGIAVVGLIGLGRRIWSLRPVGGLVRQPTASRSGPGAARP